AVKCLWFLTVSSRRASNAIYRVSSMLKSWTALRSSSASSHNERAHAQHNSKLSWLSSSMKPRVYATMKRWVTNKAAVAAALRRELQAVDSVNKNFADARQNTVRRLNWQIACNENGKRVENKYQTWRCVDTQTSTKKAECAHRPGEK